MRVLGLDPGSLHTGYGLVEIERNAATLVACGRISPGRSLPLPRRLARLSEEVSALVASWRPEVAVLESPFLGGNTRSLVVLAQARGALVAALGGAGLEVLEYSPAEVKSALTGYGAAAKEQVARMVHLLLELGGEVPSLDATDALAVALCYAHRRRLDALTRGHGRGA
ncbi:MAG: crossover junction endodeoxyribonuclease RuvC [Thermoanaerobaculia bacterium]